MLEKLREIKDKYPWAFWTAVVVVFPVGIFVVVFLLLNRNSSAGQELMEKAAYHQGQADVHEAQAAAAGERAKKQEAEIENKREELRTAIRRIQEKSKKYKETEKQIEDADSWEELDKRAGVE